MIWRGVHKQYGLPAIFIILIQSENAELNMAIYQAICEQYTLKPAECVFLDDNAANVISARAFGLNAILFLDYESAKAELETLLQREDI